MQERERDGHILLLCRGAKKNCCPLLPQREADHCKYCAAVFNGSASTAGGVSLQDTCCCGETDYLLPGESYRGLCCGDPCNCSTAFGLTILESLRPFVLFLCYCCRVSGWLLHSSETVSLYGNVKVCGSSSFFVPIFLYLHLSRDFVPLYHHSGG